MSNIGKVKLSNGDEATLHENGKWESENPALKQHLNFAFDPKRETGMGALFPFGTITILRAATDLKAKATLEKEIPALKPGELS